MPFTPERSYRHSHADAELIGDATEEIKRLREQLIECDDEIRDLRYRMHLRGYNPTLW